MPQVVQVINNLQTNVDALDAPFGDVNDGQQPRILEDFVLVPAQDGFLQEHVRNTSITNSVLKIDHCHTHDGSKRA